MTYSYYPELDASFVRIPRTGSRTIKKKLLPKHRELCDGTPQEPSRSFAFVRNPLDRFLSAYSRFKRKVVRKGAEYDVTVESLLALIDDDSVELGAVTWPGEMRLHVLPASHAHFGLDGVGALFRFECYELEWVRLQRFLDVEIRPYVPESAPKRPLVRVTPRERALVLDRLEDDFRTFGYRLPARRKT